MTGNHRLVYSSAGRSYTAYSPKGRLGSDKHREETNNNDLRVGFESHGARANLRTRSMTEAA